MDPNYERENMAKGIMRFLYIIIALLILIMIGMVTALSSCTPKAQAILPEGRIIERSGDRYLVIWPDHGDKPHAYAWNWVYQPGMGWIDIEDLEVIIIIRPKQNPLYPLDDL